MTLVNIDLQNAGYETSPDDRVVFYSPANRNEQGTIISTAETSVPLVDGQASKELAPGPVVVKILAQGVADTRPKTGYVPDMESISLVDVIAEWTPPIVDQSILAILVALDEALGDVGAAVAAEVNSIKWNRGTAPQDFAAVTTPGLYSVRSYAESVNLVTHAGKLPVFGAGFINFYYVDESRATLQFLTAGGQMWVSSISDAVAGWRPWTRVDVGAAQKYLLGTAPADIDATTSSGAYVVRTYAEANAIFSAAGKLPMLGGGELEIVVDPGRIRTYTWKIAGTLWIASWTQSSGWMTWQRIGADVTPASIGAATVTHTHTGIYATPDEVSATLASANSYTDTAFAATAPGGATDDAVDAAIDRAVLQGRLASQVDFSAVDTTGATDAAPALSEIFATGAKKITLPHGSRLRIDGRVIVPPGVTVDANNSTIVQNFATDNYAVTLQSGSALVGHLNIETMAGATRGVAAAGSNISVESLKIVCAAGGAGAGNIRGHGFLATGSNIRVNALHVEGHDFPVSILNADVVRIGALTVRGYVRGLWIEDATDIHVSGTIREASANAQIAAGHNGVLIGAGTTNPTRDVYLNVTVADSGEHGFRGAGVLQSVHFDHCTAINTGSSGFKILGDATIGGTGRMKDIHFDSCTVVGAGASTADSAFLIHYATGVTITSPIIRGGVDGLIHGLEIQGTRNLMVTGFQADDVTGAGICVRGIRGDVDDITVLGARITGQGEGLRIERGTSAGSTFSNLRIFDLDAQTTQPAVTVVGSGAGIGPGIKVRVSSSGASTLQGDFTGILIDADAPFHEGVTPAIGSRWRDPLVGIYTMSASGWTLP